MNVPDFPSTILGYRVWGVAGGASERLQSTAAGFWTVVPSWPARQRFEASCLRPGRCPDGGVPGMRHSCGIHAFRSVDDARHWARHIARVRSVVVVGEVHLWGSVAQSTRGWRAQYAYPAALLDCVGRRASGDLLRRLGEVYDVEVDPAIAA